MAIVFENIQTSDFATGDKTITKPTGLAVGWLMIAHIAGDFDSVNDITPPVGWTEIVEDVSGSDGYGHAVYAKVADSTDVAASNFTFTIGAGENAAGAIYGISGAGATYVLDNDTDTAHTTHTFSGGVTPEAANSALLFLTVKKNAGLSNTGSAYAIATSDPTWTERYDFNSTGAEVHTSAATAIRAEATATGDYSYTTDRNDVAKGALLAIRPALNATVNATSLTMSMTLTTPANIMIVNPLAFTVTLNSPTTTSEASDWTNSDRASTISATNTSKNSTSITNATKNSTSSMTNISKS